MAIETNISKRFGELVAQGEKLLGVGTNAMGSSLPGTIDHDLAVQWCMSSLSFIGRVLGRDSEHYDKFDAHSPQITNPYDAKLALAILKSAKTEIDGGYLFSVKQLVRAEVFDDLLEQADYFLDEGYFQVAAATAGAVLEDGLRKLCAEHGIVFAPKPKLDAMNSDLAKAGVYDKLVQKRVTLMADIRNKAAHGEWSKFTHDDAAEMVRGVRRFITDYLSN